MITSILIAVIIYYSVLTVQIISRCEDIPTYLCVCSTHAGESISMNLAFNVGIVLYLKPDNNSPHGKLLL